MLSRLRNEKGFALIVSLLVITVLLILGSIFILRTVTEKSMSDRQRLLTQAFYVSEASAHEGLHQLDILINTDMMNTINDTNPQTVATKAEQYTADSDGLDFLIWAVERGGEAQFTLNAAETEATYSLATTFGNGTYQYTIIMTEKSDPVTVSIDMWDLPYFYRIESIGTVGGVSRRIAISGDITVRVQRDNFAKFALFTDHHTLKSGGTVWFTGKTNFAGPLHTNERYSFAFNPSGTFYDEVVQHLSKARFYNNGSPILMDADSNSDRDVPTFYNGFTRGESEIVLPSSVQKDDLYEQAVGGENIVGNGIFVPNDGTNLTGGIFARGNTTISMSIDGNDDAVYSITEGGTTKIITVDIDNNQTSVQTVGVGTETFTGLPDGIDDLGTIVYVDGEVLSLGGTVQRDTEVTISSEFDITITDHILYSEYASATGNPGDADYVPPTANGATNLLGILSWGGDVEIGTTAPDDINIHGTVMARNGVFTVDEYDDIGEGPRGTVTLLGGMITQFYGAFGLFSGATGELLSGYGRNFIYDSRMANAGKSPPYFPTMKTFIAFTNDLTDKIIWQEGGF